MRNVAKSITFIKIVQRWWITAEVWKLWKRLKTLKRLGSSSFFPFRVNSRRRCWSDRNILCCCGIMRIKHMLKGNNDWRDMTLKWTRVLSRFIDHKPLKLTLTVYYLVKNDVIGFSSAVIPYFTRIWINHVVGSLRLLLRNWPPNDRHFFSAVIWSF